MFHNWNANRCHPHRHLSRIMTAHINVHKYIRNRRIWQPSLIFDIDFSLPTKVLLERTRPEWVHCIRMKISNKLCNLSSIHSTQFISLHSIFHHFWSLKICANLCLSPSHLISLKILFFSPQNPVEAFRMSPPAHYARHVYGRMTQMLSPFEVKSLKGCINPGFTNTCRRFGEQAPYVVPRKS